MRNKTGKIVILLMLFLLTAVPSFSQCSVCRAGAESSVEQGHSAGRGLNKGIVYLMSIPYVLGGTALYIYFKHRKKKTSL